MYVRSSSIHTIFPLFEALRMYHKVLHTRLQDEEINAALVDRFMIYNL